MSAMDAPSRTGVNARWAAPPLRRPFNYVLSATECKRFATVVAGAALAGYRLDRIEDDDGLELLVATRGAETMRFQSLGQAESWMDGLIAARAVGLQPGEEHASAL